MSIGRGLEELKATSIGRVGRDVKLEDWKGRQLEGLEATSIGRELEGLEGTLEATSIGRIGSDVNWNN